MKDILKIMRFDFLTVKPVAMTEILIISAFCFILSLIFSPMICSYIMFMSIVCVIPLQNIADKNDFNKLYGILPVKRKNITRARFLYIFLIHFITEIIEIAVALVSMRLKLYRILPNQESEKIQMIKNSFSDYVTAFSAIVGIFAVLCLVFLYTEMMGQIYGRENEFKIIMITLGIIVFIIMGFLFLSDKGIIPMLKIPDIPSSTSGKIILAAVINIVVFGLSVLFGEITASKLSKREL